MKNLLRGVSLFSNVGIAEAYLEEIGVSIKIANEIDIKRAEFYKYTYPNTEMIVGDITKDEIRSKIITRCLEENIDFLIATPPCQGMSVAGKQDPLDERNQLIYYAIDIIKAIKPKYILLENVPQQLKTKIKHNNEEMLIPDYIKKELENYYNFSKNSLIKAMDYSIPQMRERSILLLSRKDQEIIWEYPLKHKKIITLREALKDIPSLDPFLKEGYEETLKMFPDYENKKMKGLSISKWHYPPTHCKRHVEWLIRTPSGKTAFENKIYFPQKINGEKINGHLNTYRRLDWDKPSRTITQNNGVISSLACVHPGKLLNNEDCEEKRIYSDPRCFSIYELMIITSLPLDWRIPDWANERMIRQVIGEGIPSKLVKCLVQELLLKINKN